MAAKNENLGIPQSKDTFGLIQYNFPETNPLFWGPNQQTKAPDEYAEPEKGRWRKTELLSIPLAIRFIVGGKEADDDSILQIHLGYKNRDNVHWNVNWSAPPIGGAIYEYAYHYDFIQDEEISDRYNKTTIAAMTNATVMAPWALGVAPAMVQTVFQQNKVGYIVTNPDNGDMTIVKNSGTEMPGPANRYADNASVPQDIDNPLIKQRGLRYALNDAKKTLHFWLIDRPNGQPVELADLTMKAVPFLVAVFSRESSDDPPTVGWDLAATDPALEDWTTLNTYNVPGLARLP